MKNVIRFVLVCLVGAVGVRAFAEESAGMAKEGKLLFEDDFSGGKLEPKWRPGKGWFKIEDGVARATENPDDHHGAYFKAKFPYKDAVAEFSFKFDGSPRFNFTMDDNAYKGSHAGHVCHVTFAPEQVRLADTKLGGMRNDVYEKMQDPKTTPQQKKQIQESIKDKQAAFKVKLDPAAWHKARVEVVGDEMLVSVDGIVVGYLKSEGINHATKNLLGFTVSGKSTLIDNVKVWEATASPTWAEKKGSVVAAIGK